MKLTKAERRHRRRMRRQYRRVATRLNLVEHPRYGAAPIRSRENYNEWQVRDAFWQYGALTHDRKILFPETAIRADLTRQNYCCSPRYLYVDMAKVCRKCGRWFIFFALEQKYWFEDLGFFVDADCVHCQDCRHEEHVLKDRIARYDALRGQAEKTVEEWAELGQIADTLWEAGYIRKPETLRKSRMPKRLMGAR